MHKYGFYRFFLILFYILLYYFFGDELCTLENLMNHLLHKKKLQKVNFACPMINGMYINRHVYLMKYDLDRVSVYFTCQVNIIYKYMISIKSYKMESIRLGHFG